MSKTVILEDGEIEILLSYHKERLAHATEQIQLLSEQKEASERRLHELAGAHEQQNEVAADEHASGLITEHEEAEEHGVVAETEPESLHLTDDGVVLAEEHAPETEAAAEDDEEAIETEHEPDAEAEEETAEVQTSVEPTGAHQLEDETAAEEAEVEHAGEPVSKHEETAHEVSAEHEETEEEEETTRGPVAEHIAEGAELATEHAAEPVAAKEMHKGSFPA